MAERTLNDYAREVHKANEKWWIDLETGESKQRNVGELLMLATSELAEAMEGHRKNKMVDRSANRPTSLHQGTRAPRPRGPTFPT